MKHRVLINGRNSMRVSDFIQHTTEFFETLSTSMCREDIEGHFRIFNPDVYVCFIETEYEQTLNMITDLKSGSSYNNAVIVIIGDSSTCDKIEQKSGFLADLIIRRPVTPDNLALKITRYLDDINEAKQRELQAEAAEQQAAEQAAMEAAADAIYEKVKANAEKKHILIVDDDRTVLKMLKTALEETYDVTTMINGIMVDKLLETKKVDLMILDYEMPIETGASIFKRIKSQPAYAHIPVCFLTGISDKEKIMEVIALKPHGYLLKPIDMDMLSSTVKNLIG